MSKVTVKSASVDVSNGAVGTDADATTTAAAHKSVEEGGESVGASVGGGQKLLERRRELGWSSRSTADSDRASWEKADQKL